MEREQTPTKILYYVCISFLTEGCDPSAGSPRGPAERDEKPKSNLLGKVLDLRMSPQRACGARGKPKENTLLCTCLFSYLRLLALRRRPQGPAERERKTKQEIIS